MAKKKKAKDSEPNLTCSYENGPCKLMAKFSHGGAADRGKGIFSMSNVVNMRTMTTKFYHKGFFFRSEYTEKAGVMLNFCPWCGADLGTWMNAFAKAWEADAKEWDKKHPEADAKRAKAKVEHEKERREFLDNLDPKVREALGKLSDRQKEALQESWMRDGQFMRGAPHVHPNTVESICRPDRKLVSKGKKLSKFGLRVRDAAQEIPTGYALSA